MKKILIINTNFKHGGAAVMAKMLFYKMQPIFGIDQVNFAYGRGGKSYEPGTFYFGNKIESFFHIFLVRFFGLEGYGTFFATLKLIKFIEKEKFNIIHLHNLHGYYVNFFWLLKWLNKKQIKVVWSLHDEWLLTWLPAHSLDCNHCLGANGKCVNYYNYPKNYLPIFKNKMLKNKKDFFNYKNITFVSPADWLYDKIKILQPNVNIKKINNGININLFKPRDKNIIRDKYNLPLNKKIILLTATNFADKNKGGKFIFELLADKTLSDCLFVSFGKGKIKNFLNLINFGHLTELKKIAELYSLADIFCFPSVAETASLSVLEALASGLPVIAFNIPANKFLELNHCGILAKEQKSLELSKNILNLLNNSNELQQISANAHDFAFKNFDENLISIEYINVYNNL